MVDDLPPGQKPVSVSGAAPPFYDTLSEVKCLPGIFWVGWGGGLIGAGDHGAAGVCGLLGIPAQPRCPWLEPIHRPHGAG